MAENVPPHSIEAEKSVLGAIMKYPDSIMTALEKIRPSDFYYPKHRDIFATCERLSITGDPCDIVTVATALGDAGGLEKVGGRVYLVDLVEGVVSTSFIPKHCGIIKDKSTLRQLIHIATEVTNSAYEQTSPVVDILNSAESQIFKLTEQVGSNQFTRIGEHLPGVLKLIEDYQTGEVDQYLIYTGFSDLDVSLQGLIGGEYIVIAGRPSHGKTQLALQILEYNAHKRKVPCGILSLEMNAQSLAFRLLSTFTRISSDDMRRRNGVSQLNMSRLCEAVNALYDIPLYVDDCSFLSTTELVSKARKLKAERKIQILAVDYLQLMSGVGKQDSRVLEVSQISRTLKAVAKDLNIPVLALSQLSRDNQKSNRKPQLSDLRDSGAIEQDADVVLFPYHWEDKGKKLAEIMVGKRRNGGRNDVPMTFLHGRWENFTIEDEERNER